MHTFDDHGGYPGGDLDRTYHMLSGGGGFDWFSPTPIRSSSPPVSSTSPSNSSSNYPSCDALGVDALAGTHNWTGYQGSWAPTTIF